MQTERPHAQAMGLDLLSGTEVLAILHEGQVAAAESVRTAIPALEQGADAMAAAIRSGRAPVPGWFAGRPARD